METRNIPLIRFSTLFITLIFLSAIVCGCAQRQVLRVALFPYLPDAHKDNFDSLEHYLKQEFQRRNPGVDLQLRPMNPADEQFYDALALKQWLMDSNLYDVVEIDTLLLGDLMQSGAIAPWPSSQQNDWFPVAEQSVKLNGVVYGVPHLLCGHFVFSRSERLAKANTASQLVQAVRSLDNDKRDLAANLAGSWNLPALYVDAWQDTWPSQPAAKSLGIIEADSFKSFKDVVHLGVFGGTNACLNGGFDYPNEDLAADMFARDEVDLMLGYSERLHRIIKSGAPAEKIFVASAALGAGNKPIFFTDALVIRHAAPKQVRNAAERFANFLNSSEVQERLLMSTETNRPSVPRYLLPATKSAYSGNQIRRDPFYKVFLETTQKAVPYPNMGFPGIRKKMQQDLKQQLQN